jgi:hypothetical protein
MEVLAMIASEADDEDVPTQRLVGTLWASATKTRFASLFYETAFEFKRSGLLDMLAVCKDPKLGPCIGILTVIVDLKRRRPADFQRLYSQALAALKVHGQSVRLGVCWTASDTGELVTPKLASFRLIGFLENTVLPAACTAALDCNNLLFQLPDPSSTVPEANDYRKIVQWMSVVWKDYRRLGGSFNPNIIIRYADSTAGVAGTPTISFTRTPDKVECRNLRASHMEPFFGLFQSRHHQEIHLSNCAISGDFCRSNNGTLHTLTMDNVTIYET